MPFEKLVEALSPERSLAHAPLVQIAYTHQPAALGALPPVPSLSVEAFGREAGGQQFDLALETREDAGGLIAGRFGYALDLFREATVARLAKDYAALLDAVTADPSLRLDAIALVSPEELDRLSAPYPAKPLADAAVHALIAARAAAGPDAPAVICADETLSRAQLEAMANRIAHRLLRLGVEPEARIGIMLPRSGRLIAALLGVLKAGAAFLPLDPALPAERIAAMLKNAGARLVLTHGDRVNLRGVRTLILDDASLGDEPATAPAVTVHPEQIAYVIYTSGSTGTPKGVAVAHGPLSRHCQATAEVYDMDAASRELHVLSMSFDGAHERWITPLIVGGAVVLRGEDVWSAEETLAAIARHGVNNAGFPAAYLRHVAEHAASISAPPPPVRLYSFGGEAMGRAGFELIKSALKPGWLINGYGPTEAVISPLVWKAEAASASVEGAAVPIGRAVGKRRAYVLDGSFNAVPQGARGELYIGGDLARGYLGQPGFTAERFLPDPFAGDGSRLYRTGDIVRLMADGQVEYLGRADAQMKLRGFRIEPGEIEAALAEEETVAEAAAVLKHGPAGARLVAYVTPTPGAAPVPATLRAKLAAKLPAYMVPARILVLAAMPHNSNGKLDRAALPDPIDDAAETIIAPTTELERQIAAIWRDVLKLETIGTDQNFFEIGGDSLAALKVLTALRALLPDRRITVAELFSNQDIRSLAAALTAEAVSGCEVVHLRRSGTQPTLYCFPGLMVNTREYAPLVKHLGEDQPATGFVCYSLAEDKKSVASVEQIARQYADYIRERERGKSCVMLGWSWGGVLAFEAARMLAGEVEVRFIGMLDVCNLDVNFAVGALAEIDEGDRRRLDRRVAEWLARTPMRHDWENLFARMGPKLYTQFLRYLQTIGSDLPSDGPGVGSKEYELWTFLDNTLLYQRYSMQPLDAPVHVWQAEESVRRGLDLVDWRRYSRRVERSVVIPGVTHREIVDAAAFHASFAESLSGRSSG